MLAIHDAGLNLKSPYRATWGPMTTATVRKLLARAGELAKLSIPIHPHMLRHACGYKLANDGHDTRAVQSRPTPVACQFAATKVRARESSGRELPWPAISIKRA